MVQSDKRGKSAPDISTNQLHGKPPHWDYTDPTGAQWECDKAGDIFQKGVQWW